MVQVRDIMAVGAEEEVEVRGCGGDGVMVMVERVGGIPLNTSIVFVEMRT